MSTFNERTSRARIGAGWAHDSTHFHFARQHKSRAPFAENNRPIRITFMDFLSGVMFAVGLALFAARLKGWI